MATRERKNPVRCVYMDGNMTPDRAYSEPKHVDGQVYCVIGPFKNHTHRAELKAALRILLKGYNRLTESETDND